MAPEKKENSGENVKNEPLPKKKHRLSSFKKIFRQMSLWYRKGGEVRRDKGGRKREVFVPRELPFQGPWSKELKEKKLAPPFSK